MLNKFRAKKNRENASKSFIRIGAVPISQLFHKFQDFKLYSFSVEPNEMFPVSGAKRFHGKNIPKLVLARAERARAFLRF